jgi:hypothetical protein
MSQLKIISTLIFYNLLFISCSTSQSQLNNYAQKINIVDLEAWINLMPGGPGSFHIVGVYEFTDTVKCGAKLEIIKVISDNELIYELNKDIFTCESQIENREQSFRYNFNTNPGIKLNEKIQIVEKVDVKLIFDFDGSTIKKDIYDIILTRAY